MNCSAPQCGSPLRSKGLRPWRQKTTLCAKHYAKFLRTGTLVYERLRDGKAKQRSKVKSAAWKKANWPHVKAYLAARKSHMKQATPPWADMHAITEFYRKCPPGHHVDHIIPLHGKGVSGLHVHWNLQYLTASANMRKGAAYQPIQYDPLGLMAKKAG